MLEFYPRRKNEEKNEPNKVLKRTKQGTKTNQTRYLNEPNKVLKRTKQGTKTIMFVRKGMLRKNTTYNFVKLLRILWNILKFPKKHIFK